jgi:hypothetical protein
MVSAGVMAALTLAGVNGTERSRTPVVPIDIAFLRVGRAQDRAHDSLARR